MNVHVNGDVAQVEDVDVGFGWLCEWGSGCKCRCEY